MVRALTTQASHTYGVLDPLVIERRDTKFVAASLSDAVNVISLPQGGYVDRGGTTRVSFARRKLDIFTIHTAMLGAPNGGSVAVLTDGNPANTFTTGAVSGAEFIVLTIDLGAKFNVAAVDITNFSSATADRDDCFVVRYSKDGVWTDLDLPVNLRTTRRNRRFAASPSEGFVSARYLRIVVTGGAGPGAISLRGVTLYTEGAENSDAIVRCFQHADDVNYSLVLTQNNIDVYRDSAWVAAVSSNFSSNMLRRIKMEADYDTILLYHPATPTRRLQWQGSDHEWQMDYVTYENIPLVDYGGVYSNGVDEVQRLNFYDYTNGQGFQLILEGTKTANIAYSTTSATTAANIKTALEALPGVDPGLTVTDYSADLIEVKFTGGGNAARDWGEMVAISTKPNTYLSIGTRIKGKAAGEDIMSTAQGWPAVGRFTQERTVMGGIPASPGTLLGSVTGEPFNLDTEISGAIAAVSYDLAGDENTITEIYVGRTIIVFTSANPWHLSTPKLSATAAPEILRSDAPGISPFVPALSLSNSVYYVEKGGRSIVSLSYSELERNFIGDNASVLSAFLVNNPIDWTLRRAVKGNDADVLFYINEDGQLVSVTLMRSQEVSGFMPHATQGKFVSVATDAARTTWVIAERQTGNDTRLMLERMEPELQLDSAVEFNFRLPSTRLAGLEAFEAQDMQVIADGAWQGTFTVRGGKINLPRAVSAARAGLWTAPRAVDTPYYPEEEARQPMGRLKRVFGVDVSVADTEAIAISANGGRLHAMTLAAATTDTLRWEGMPGFTADAKLTISQTRPGRLLVRSVKKRIAA